MASPVLVRAPLSTGKSGSVDKVDGYTYRIRNLAGELREQAATELKLNIEVAEIPSYIAALMGKQWGAGRPRYRSSFVDNRLAKARVESKAFLTDIQPTIDIKSHAGDVFQDQADIIQRVIHSEWRRINMDLRLAETIDHANFGVGYCRLGAILPGQMIYRALGSDSVMPIQRGDTIQESSAVLYSATKPATYFIKMFPGRTAGLERYYDSTASSMTTNRYQRPGHIDEYTWKTMPQYQQYLWGGRGARPESQTRERIAFPTCKLEEFWIEDPSVNESGERILVRNPNLTIEQHNYWYWVEPGQPLWPRKRLVIFAGEELCMYDGPGPYWHGQYPFGELILDPVVWGSGGLSRYRTLLPINRGINEVNAGFFDLVKKAMNQALITKRGAVPDAVFDRFFQDMPGGKMMMTPGADPTRDLRYGPVPVIPGYMPQFLQHLYQAFDRQSGGVDPKAFTGKKQMPAADAIQQIKDSQSGQFRLEGRYVEAFLTSLGPQAVSNVIQFWTCDQRMTLLGIDGTTRQDWTFRPGSLAPLGQPKEDHWKNFDTEVLPGSMHGSSREAEQNKWVNLYRLGAISLQELHRRLELSGSARIIAEIAQEHQQGMGSASKPRPQRSSGQKRGAST
jgi:hypothetical protein